MEILKNFFSYIENLKWWEFFAFDCSKGFFKEIVCWIFIEKTDDDEIKFINKYAEIDYFSIEKLFWEERFCWSLLIDHYFDDVKEKFLREVEENYNLKKEALRWVECCLKWTVFNLRI